MLKQIYDLATFRDNINEGNHTPHCKDAWLSILGLAATNFFLIFGTHYEN